MATLFEAANGTTTLLPTTSWAAPNGLFGAADRNDSSAYGWADSTSTVTLPSTGLADGYLFLWGFEFEDTSNGRHNPVGKMVQASGTGTFASAQTSGYNRDNSEDRAYVSGWSFVDNPSASSTYQFQWKRDADAPTGGTVRSFIQVIPLYYADVGVYTSTTAANYGGTTPNLITGFSGTDGTNITITSDQVSVTGDNKRYLCLGSGYLENASGGARTQRWFGFEIDGAFDHAAKGCAYIRNASNDFGGESFIRLIETVTATRTVELNCYRGDGVAAGQGGADVDGTGTENNAAHAMVVIELNDSAEVYSSTDSVGGQEFALTGPVDVDIASTGDIEFNDSASFTRSTDTAVNCEKAMDVFAFANISHAREASSIGSGARWTVHGEFTINGTEQTGVGFHGNYNRGNQTSQDCHGSSTNQAAFFAVTTGQDIGVSNQELTGTEGGNGDIETQAGWVGFGLINLDTLEEAGGSPQNLNANHIGTSYTMHAPSVNPGEVTVTADFIASGTVMHGPLMNPQLTRLGVDGIHRGIEVYSDFPKSAGGSTQNLEADFIGTGYTLHEPTSSTTVDLSADYLGSGSSLHEPTFSTIYTFTLDAIGTGSSLHEPTLSAGESNIAADKIGPDSALYEPTLAPGEVTISVDFLGSGHVLHEPSLDNSSAIQVDYLSANSSLHEPTLVPGEVTIALDAIASSHTLYSPTVTTPSIAITTLGPAGIPRADQYGQYGRAQNATIVGDIEITITVNGTMLVGNAFDPGFIGSGSTLYEPAIVQQQFIGVDYIASGSSLYEPTVTTVAALQISLDFIGTTTVMYEPAVDGGFAVTPGVERYIKEKPTLRSVEPKISVPTPVETAEAEPAESIEDFVGQESTLFKKSEPVVPVLDPQIIEREIKESAKSWKELQIARKKAENEEQERIQAQLFDQRQKKKRMLLTALIVDELQ